MARKITLLSLLVATILIVSSTIAAVLPIAPASAQQPASQPIPSGDRAARNWEYINHDAWASNYSPQTEINKDNARHLELKWIFPFPAGAAAEIAKRLKGVSVQEGSIAPPLVVDGTTYVATNARDTYAYDLETGKVRWTNQFEFDFEAAKAKNPALGTGNTGHIHGINYANGLLWTSNLFCTLRLVDAQSGSLAFQSEDECLNIPGNVYDWPMYKGVGRCGVASHPGAIYRKDNILIQVYCGADGPNGGRQFVTGYDLNQKPPKRIWTAFLQPPGEGDPEWAIKACNNARAGWYFSYPAFFKEGKLGINCKDVPRENVINDWGVPKHYTTAVSAQWGQMAMDEESGIVYFATGNQGGWANHTFTPGPSLYASAILALEAKTGKIVWWYQTTTRDMVESDASWNTILAKLPIGGQERKVIIKFTTTGLIWALDAANGEPLWLFEAPFLRSRVDPDGVVRGRTACAPKVGANPSTQDGYWNDPMSRFDMQEKRWIEYPSKEGACIIPIRAGESDIALDTDRNTIYVAIAQGWNWDILKALPHGTIGVGPAFRDTFMTVPRNTTIFAVDAITGKSKWSFFIAGVAFRGGVIASGGVVYAPSADGYLYLLDAESGKLLDKKFLGVALATQPTIGKTVGGKSRLIQTNGLGFTGARLGALQAGGAIPGAVMVFGLPDKIPEPAEVVREALKEVPKEQLKEVLKDIPKEALSELAPPAETISPISYGIVGIGIVLVVIAGVLFARRKRA